MKKIAPLVFVGAGIFGCATQPQVKPSTLVPIREEVGKWIDLKNGFSAESYKVHDNILLLTEVFLGEVFLKKTDKGYEGIKTYSYHTTPTEKFDRTYDEFCETIDNGGDKFLTEMETLSFMNRVYQSIYEPELIGDE